MRISIESISRNDNPVFLVSMGQHVSAGKKLLRVISALKKHHNKITVVLADYLHRHTHGEEYANKIGCEWILENSRYLEIDGLDVKRWSSFGCCLIDEKIKNAYFESYSFRLAVDRWVELIIEKHKDRSRDGCLKFILEEMSSFNSIGVDVYYAGDVRAMNEAIHELSKLNIILRKWIPVRIYNGAKPINGCTPDSYSYSVSGPDVMGGLTEKQPF
jgi:hypothetical protein